MLSIIETQILIALVILTSLLFSNAAQQTYICREGEMRFRTSRLLYFFSFLIPWICISFTDSGSDYYNYYDMIDRLTWDNYYMFFSEEPGWNIFTLTIRTLLNDNTHLTIFAIKTITLSIIFYVIYSYSSIYKVQFSILSYLLLNYIASFYLISIAFSVALSTLAISLLYKYELKVLGAVIIIIAGLLHNSSFIFLPIYIALILYRNNVSRKIKIIFTIGFLSAGVLASSVYSFAMSNIEAFHYGNYGSVGFRGSGISIVIIYVPLFYFISRLSYYLDDKQLFNYIYIYALADCMFNVLSYQFFVIERMQFYTIPLYAIFIPLAIQSIRNSNTRGVISIQRFMYIFILFKGIQEFIGRTTSMDAVAHYHFFSPF